MPLQGLYVAGEFSDAYSRPEGRCTNTSPCKEKRQTPHFRMNIAAMITRTRTVLQW